MVFGVQIDLSAVFDVQVDLSTVQADSDVLLGVQVDR